MENRLKFKVWDNVNKCWVNLTGLAIDCQTGELCCSWVDSLYVNDECRDAKDFTIVQFTSYYGSNAELYEGDIVKERHNGYIAVIDWGDAQFGFNPVDSAKWLDEWNFPDDAHRMEVIGNIFETPELVR